MDNQQAKLILTAYRPHGQDACDPFFAEALQQAGHDPALAAWFKEQQLFDTAVATALAGVHGPDDAKAMIKATMGASARTTRRWTPWMLAAGMAVLLGLAVVLLRFARPEPLFPGNATPGQLAVNLAEHHASLGLMSGELERVNAWLAGRGAPLPGRLPAGLAGLQILGCESWETKQGKVSLICFVQNGEVAHLYVFDDAAAFPGLPDALNPRLEQEGQWALALWQEQGRAYVLGVPATGSLTLDRLLHG